MSLTVHQREVLEFERRFPRHTGDKSVAIREFFQMSVADYERDLDEVLSLPAAQEYDPLLVRRVSRFRRGQRWFHERQQHRWV